MSDLKAAATYVFTFSTTLDGVPSTLGGVPVVSIYKDSGNGEVTTGVTLTADADGRVGMNRVSIDLSDAFYAAGSCFAAVITTGTINGVSVAGLVVNNFTIEKAPVNWAQVSAPTSAVNLSATNIDVDQIVASVSGAVGSVTGAVGSVTGNVGGNVAGSVGSVVGAVGSVTGAVGSVTGNVGGNVTGTVASVVGNIGGNLLGTLTTTERDAIAAALLDLADAIETGLTVRQALRLGAAADAGKVSGMATATVVIRNAVADSKDRITATCDVDGNRSAITCDLS